MQPAPTPTPQQDTTPVETDSSGPLPPLPTSGMSAYAWAVFPAALLLVSLLAFGILCYQKATAGIQLGSASAAVTFTTGAALVIERITETGWAIFATTQAGSYWPMTGASAYVGQLVTNLENAFHPFLTEATNALGAASKTKEEVSAAVQALKQDVAKFRQEIADLNKLGKPNNQQGLLLSAATAQRIQYLSDKYSPTLQNMEWAAKIAGSAVDGLQTFVATFKDNPGRRIISICVGGILGIVVTSFLQLDIFQALSDPASTAAAAKTAVGHDLSLSAAFHIVLTGLVIGLGASPTHEVIRLVQEAKETRKGANASQPDQS